jgi:hypothetical protein
MNGPEKKSSAIVSAASSAAVLVAVSFSGLAGSSLHSAIASATPKDESAIDLSISSSASAGEQSGNLLKLLG